MGVHLRVAEVGDLQAVMRLENTIFSGEAWSVDIMRNEITHPHTHYVVAESDGSAPGIVGYGGLLALGAGTAADIQTVAVAKNCRRRGIGRRLIDALLAEARTRRVSEVFLDVRADNGAAQELYRSEGFVPVSVRRAYYQPDGVDAIVMRLVFANSAESESH